jgi:hypothetical protein
MSVARTKSTKRSRLLLIFGGILAAALGASWMIMSQVTSQVESSDDYIRTIQSISDQSKSFTQSYEDSIGKWRDGKIDRGEMLQITDDHLGRLEGLLGRLDQINPPERFRMAHQFTMDSLTNELESDRHMRNYVDTGNEDEYQKSVEFLQKAFDYETRAFAEFGRASKK